MIKPYHVITVSFTYLLHLNLNFTVLITSFNLNFPAVHTNKPIRCCDNSGLNLTPRYKHPSCMPISVPSNDPYYKEKYVTCMEYTRSVTTYRGDCTFGASEQVSRHGSSGGTLTRLLKGLKIKFSFVYYLIQHFIETYIFYRYSYVL